MAEQGSHTPQVGGSNPPPAPKPPSMKKILFRIFWLTKVRRMDLKKVLFGGAAAFVVGFVAVLPALLEGGITQSELMSAVAAGLGALGLYLKDPNAHKGPDPR